MGFRFWRRIKLAPGVTLNLSKSGGSVSLGPRGAKYTMGQRGNRATVGIPGTGLFYTVKPRSGRTSRRSGSSSRQAPGGVTVRSRERLTLGFFKRLITSDDEKALVDGCRELIFGDEARALEHLRLAAHLSDGAYLAGFLAMKRGIFGEAETFLKAAAEKHRNLGRYFYRYGISAVMTLPVTDEVSAQVQPDLRGVLLGLVEVYQHQKRWEKAISSLERLRGLEPFDVVINVSLAELLLEARPGADTYRKIVHLAEGMENTTPFHAAMLLYKAKSLRLLGLATAARDASTAGLRRKKGRPAELLRALRYERALAYLAMGRKSRARADFEILYSEEPEYEDVASRLGL